MPGVTSEMITRQMKNPNNRVMAKEELLQFLKGRKLEVLLTVGAGDIDAMVKPIKNILISKYHAKAK
jgi:UDP-N-acetylmuramate--alanine ligase